MTSRIRGIQATTVIHDEIIYEWKPDMSDFVYARDAGGVTHYWYKTSKYGHSGCGVLREDVQQFLVEAEVTCMGCIATHGEGAGTIGNDELERQIFASLGVPVKFLGDYVDTFTGRRRRFS